MESSSDPFALALAEARSRRNIKLFNALMSRSARFGELENVLRAFATLKALRLTPNEFTFGILLNAYTRCGEIERCVECLAEMRRDGLPVTAIALTTVIKGCVNALDLGTAWIHFDELRRAADGPTIRTVNTMLRGCLYCGDMRGARKLVKMAKRYGLEPDQATRDGAVRAACQSFRPKRIKRALATHAPDGMLGMLSPATLVDVAIAHALTGKYRRAAKVLKLLEAAPAVDGGGGGQSGGGDQSSGGVGSNSGGGKRGGKGADKRGGKGGRGGGERRGGGGRATGTSAASAALHAHAMLRDSLASVRAFLARSPAERDRIVAGFTTAGVRRFPPVADAHETTRALVWEEVFADAARPIHLEVGAGTGDWVVLQAASQLEINWAAVELRSDRSNLIHAKAAMRGLTNLAVLAGDAHGVLRDGIPSRSAAAVLVNFPQPPQGEHSERHLVNRTFLIEAHRILQPGGTFTLTSDDEPYCKSVALRLTTDPTLTRLWQPSFAPPHYKTHEHQSLRAHRSAFDELWAARGFTKRFQCVFTARRPRAPGTATMPGLAPQLPLTGTEDAHADENQAGGGSGSDAKRKRRTKETSRQRKKRKMREKEKEEAATAGSPRRGLVTVTRDGRVT